MHIYKREFAVSEGTELILPADELNQCWEIGFPPVGRITRFVLTQNGGTAIEAQVDLLDRQVCDLGSGSSVSLLPQDTMTVSLARIFPQQTLASGGTLDLFEGVSGEGPWSYRNREGTFTVPKRAVYLHVVVAANVDGKKYELTVACEVGGELN